MCVCVEGVWVYVKEREREGWRERVWGGEGESAVFFGGGEKVAEADTGARARVRAAPVSGLLGVGGAGGVEGVFCD